MRSSRYGSSSKSYQTECMGSCFSLIISLIQPSVHKVAFISPPLPPSHVILFKLNPTVAYRLLGDVHGRELLLVLDGLDLAALGLDTHPDNVIQEVAFLLDNDVVILIIAVPTLMDGEWMKSAI